MPLLILIVLAMTGAALYLRTRTSPQMFASLAVLIGLGVYISGILFIQSWYHAQLAHDRLVEGKGLFGALFFLSAFSGLWIGSATATLIANASAMRGMRIAGVASAVALFLLTLIATIPIGIHLGFALIY